MADLHPAASQHLPAFITGPGETDVLMVIMGVFLLLAVMAFGIIFLRLHSLPERIAHRSNKLQFEIVAVLCLIALFTHIHIFWLAALLLALIDLPDFGTPLGRIAGSLERIAGMRTSGPPEESTPRSASSSAADLPGEEFSVTNHSDNKIEEATPTLHELPAIPRPAVPGADRKDPAHA